MDAIDLIRHEHRQIMRLLDRMQEAVDAGRRGERVNPVLFRRAAEFLRVFVEGAHHAKEAAMWKELIARGLPQRSGVLAQLAEEHSIGHEHTVALKDLAEKVIAGKAGNDLLFDAAEAYIRLHMAHSAIEESQLMPMAQRLLGVDGLDRLRSAFARIEARYGSLVEAADAVEVAFGPAGHGIELRRGGE